MNSLLFGTSGIPLSTKKPDTMNGIKRVKELGLDNMEIEFVHSINLSKEKAPLIKETANKERVNLTCHGQYAINCNALDPAKLKASSQRIIEACERANEAGVWSICYHMAYYLKDDPTIVTKKITPVVKEIAKELENRGVKLWLRPETGGRISQWGELQELIELSQNVEGVLPCIDWAHHHSRSIGKYNTTTEYQSILEALEKGLGRECLDNMHCHMEGIKYGEKGEQHHLNLEESDMNWKDCVKVWKEFKIKGVITCESPNVEKDALMLQKYYQTSK